MYFRTLRFWGCWTWTTSIPLQISRSVLFTNLVSLRLCIIFTHICFIYWNKFKNAYSFAIYLWSSFWRTFEKLSFSLAQSKHFSSTPTSEWLPGVGISLHSTRVWHIPFFDRIQIPNIIGFSEITEYQISNTIRYWENQNTKYRVLFGIKKIRITNMNSTIRSNYLNTKY